LKKIEVNRKERVYGMIEGSMLQMEQGWQETKVGRVFKAELLENSDPLKWEIGVSEYIANPGHCSEFIGECSLNCVSKGNY
jgi:hypothetical protein